MIAEKDLEYQPVEPERYELYAEPTYHFRLDRREFFKALGGGIVVLFTLPVPAEAALSPQDRGESGGGGRRGGGQQRAPREIGAWLHIGEDSIVTVFTGKAEVGQDIRTSLAQAVAEELHAPISSLRMVLGDTDLTPFDAGTFGSRSTPIMNPQLRRVAAAARAVLIELAAEKAGAGTSPDSLTTENGRVRHAASGKEWIFGELAKGRKLTKEVGEETPTTPPDAWRVAGTSVPKIDGRDVVTGKRRYTSDLKRPGMMHGKVLRAPAIGSTLVSVDTKAAEAIPGVVVVRDGDFVGVVAPTSQAAFQASTALKAEWRFEPNPVSHKSLYEHLRKGVEEGEQPQGRGGPSRNGEGDIAEGMKAAKHTVKSAFNIAYIAHAPLEPRAAVAEWGEDGRLTVWTGTQRPFGVKAELAAAFRLPEERIRVIQGDTGSGYGGKHTGEAALEAARLAKAAGKPVRVMWSREEEFTHAYFRPAGVIEVAGGITESGDMCAWEYHNYNSGQAGIRMPYAVPNTVIAFHPAHSPVRQGSYRALAATANTFARETVLDELAQKAGMDPLAFRLRNLKEERLRAVFIAAANAFGWDKRKKTPGRGFGIGGGTEKGGFVAACAEVSVGKPNGAVKVDRIVIAFECGAVINPDGLSNQVEGAVLMGLGGALFEQIEFADGRIDSNRFSRYRVPRFSDTPKIEVIMVNRKDLPSAGAGEAPIIAVAPAIGNALFDATGIRLRALPLAPSGVRV